MENELKQMLEEQDRKIEAIYVSVEKTRKYFLTTMIITVAMVILPLLGLLIAIPKYLQLINSLGAY